MLGFEPIQPARLIDEVHRRLRELILSGALSPHQRLRQLQLAEALGISRTPVREALLRLEREGLVYTKGGHGMFVKGIGPAEVEQLYEVRAALEPAAARLACLRATERDIALARGIQRAHRRAYPRDLPTAFRSNHDLHMALVKPCANPLMLRFLENVWDHDSALRIFAAYTGAPARIQTMVAEHEELVVAYAARDADRLAHLLEAHIHTAAAALAHATREAPTDAAADAGTRQGAGL